MLYYNALSTCNWSPRRKTNREWGKKKKIANNFPNLMKNINLLIQDIQQTAKKDKHKDCQPVANC